jgi:hypothetical protein
MSNSTSGLQCSQWYPKIKYPPDGLTPPSSALTVSVLGQKLTRRRAIFAVVKLASSRKHGLAIGLSKEKYHRMSRPKSNKVEKKSEQQQSLTSNVQFKPGIQSRRSFLLLRIPFVRRQMPRSPSQLRRKCRVICKKPGCRRRSSVAGCNAARGLG